MNETKDFEKYVYFRSKASNYALCISPRRTAVVEGEVVVKSEGLRVEFRNRMLRLEVNKLNAPAIKAIRDAILEEKDLIPTKKMLFEEKEADVMVSQTIVDAKEAEIATLKKELKDKENPVTPPEGKTVRVPVGSATPEKDK